MHDDTQEKIDELYDLEQRIGKLSPWEAEFIESIKEQYEARGSLSMRQEDKLNDIWGKYCGD